MVVLGLGVMVRVIRVRCGSVGFRVRVIRVQCGSVRFRGHG